MTRGATIGFATLHGTLSVVNFAQVMFALVAHSGIGFVATLFALLFNAVMTAVRIHQVQPA